MMDEQFFGTQPGIPPYEEMAGDVRPDKTEKIGATFVWVFAQQSLNDLTELTDDRDETKALRYNRPDLGSLSDQQLWERFREMLPMHRKMFAHHLFTSYMATVPIGVISAVATAVGRPDLIMPIISGIGDVDSAAPSHAMWALSRLDPASAEFTTAFDDFVHEFGSRGPNEWESRSPSWETRHKLALVAIDCMRQAPDNADPARAVRGPRRATCRRVGRIAGHGCRRPGHARTTRCSDRLFCGVAAGSRAHQDQQHQSHPRDAHGDARARAVGWSTAARSMRSRTSGSFEQAEMPTLLDRPAFADRGDARRAAAEYQNLQQLEPPFVFVGHTDGPDTWPRRDAVRVDRLSEGDTITGLPGCPGVAEGTARVVLDSNDPSALQPGDVLIAPITDPSWTPLFVPAAAVVVDVGAALSHAIIVSRELGIPCVVSAIGATRNIPDGARVRVDGNTGVVTILSVS